MLEKPNFPDKTIIDCLKDKYGMLVEQLDFLPLGADQNTAVYQALASDHSPYFVKLRSGVFDETSVALPKFLSDQGIAPVIAALTTDTGQLWTALNGFTLVLYPYIAGQDGYELDLPERQWRLLGAALRSIHAVELPPALASAIQPEDWSPRWRAMVKTFLQRAEHEVYGDAVGVEVAALLRARRGQILDLIGRAERLARALQERAPQFVLCHSDLHAGNVLVTADQSLYIVDWDNPIFAPKERDLMYIGGGLMGNHRPPREEEILFYQGYGPARIDPIALAYYRYERIIQDIAAFCQQLLLTSDGGADREQSLQYLKSNFLPGNTIEIAYNSDQGISADFHFPLSLFP